MHIQTLSRYLILLISHTAKCINLNKSAGKYTAVQVSWLYCSDISKCYGTWQFLICVSLNMTQILWSRDRNQTSIQWNKLHVTIFVYMNWKYSTRYWNLVFLSVTSHFVFLRDLHGRSFPTLNSPVPSPRRGLGICFTRYIQSFCEIYPQKLSKPGKLLVSSDKQFTG